MVGMDCVLLSTYFTAQLKSVSVGIFQFLFHLSSSQLRPTTRIVFQFAWMEHIRKCAQYWAPHMTSMNVITDKPLYCMRNRNICFTLLPQEGNIVKYKLLNPYYNPDNISVRVTSSSVVLIAVGKELWDTWILLLIFESLCGGIWGFSLESLS